MRQPIVNAHNSGISHRCFFVTIVAVVILTSLVSGNVASQTPNAPQVNKQANAFAPRTLKARLVLPAEPSEIGPVAVSRDGRLVATVVSRRQRSRARRLLGLVTLSSMKDQLRSDSTIKIWDAGTGELKKVIHDISVGDYATMVFSPNTLVLLTIDESWPIRMKLWDVQTGHLLFEGRGWPAGFSPDGNTLAITPEPFSKQCNTRLIDVATGSLKATLTVGTKPRTELADLCRVRIYFSNDNQRLITVSSDRDSELWDMRTGRQLAVLSGTDNPTYSYWDGDTEMFSPDGKTAVTAQTDFSYPHSTRTLNIWDASNGKLLRSIDAAAEPVRFSPDGKVFAARSTQRSEKDVSFSLWDVETGKLVKTFRERKAGAGDIAWSPDGQTIAVAGDKLRIWDVDSGKLKATLPVVVDWEFNFVGTVGNWDQLFVSPDSHFLIAANQKSTRIIDVKSGALLEKIDKLRLGAFTPDGYWITRTIDKKSVTVWEIPSN